VERRIAERLPEAFIEAHVKWHTRSRLRDGCNCNFCIEKRAGTRYIGCTPFPSVAFKSYVAQQKAICTVGYPPVDDINEMAREVVRRERMRKIKKVRERLEECKREVL
jgi:hypothetical protein